MKIAILNIGDIETDHRIRRDIQWLRTKHEVTLFHAAFKVDGLYREQDPVEQCRTIAVSERGCDNLMPMIIQDECDPDVIIAHELDGLSVLCAKLDDRAIANVANGSNLYDAGARPRRLSCAVVYAPHEYEPDRPLLPRTKIRRPEFEALLATVVDAAVSPCDPITNHLQRLGISHTETITNAPYKLPDGWEPDPDYLQEALDIDANYIVVHSGNISHSRALAPLIEAIRILENVALVMIGRSLVHPSYIDYAHRAGVYFVNSLAYPHDGNTHLFRALSGADCAFIGGETTWANHRYQLPNKFFECGFARVPIVAPNWAECCRSMICDYDLGSLYPGKGVPTAADLASHLSHWITRHSEVDSTFHDAEHYEAKNGPAWDRLLEEIKT